MSSLTVSDISVGDTVITTPTTQVEIQEVEVTTVSGSTWYQLMSRDRTGRGAWLPKKNWAPLVFYILLFLFCTFLGMLDPDINFVRKGQDLLSSLVVGILVVCIIAMLILSDHPGWAWFIALLPFILILFCVVLGILFVLFEGSCPNCTGTCTRNH